MNAFEEFAKTGSPFILRKSYAYRDKKKHDTDKPIVRSSFCREDYYDLKDSKQESAKLTEKQRLMMLKEELSIEVLKCAKLISLHAKSLKCVNKRLTKMSKIKTPKVTRDERQLLERYVKLITTK